MYLNKKIYKLYKRYKLEFFTLNKKRSSYTFPRYTYLSKS